MEVLRMIPIDNKYIEDHYLCELTEFLDDHMIGDMHRSFLRFGNYCMKDCNDGIIPIRYPGATRGHIRVDENNIVIEIKLYNMTGGVAYGGKIYKDGTDEKIQKFLGCKIEWNE